MAGDWSVVSPPVVNEPPPEQPLSIGVKKRKLEGQEEVEEAGEAIVRSGWGANTKRYPGQDTKDLDDLLAGSIPLKKEKPEASSTDRVKTEEEDGPKQGSSRVCDGDNADRLSSPPIKDQVSDEGAQKVEDSLLKTEADDNDRVSSALDKIPEETSIPVFKKKRKAKAS